MKTIGYPLFLPLTFVATLATAELQPMTPEEQADFQRAVEAASTSVDGATNPAGIKEKDRLRSVIEQSRGSDVGLSASDKGKLQAIATKEEREWTKMLQKIQTKVCPTIVDMPPEQIDFTAYFEELRKLDKENDERWQKHVKNLKTDLSPSGYVKVVKLMEDAPRHMSAGVTDQEQLAKSYPELIGTIIQQACGAQPQ